MTPPTLNKRPGGGLPLRATFLSHTLNKRPDFPHADAYHDRPRVAKDINQEVLNFRAELDKETDADKDIARKTKALIDYAARSQRAINKNLWVPDTKFFTEFACDTLVNVQVKDLSGYMRVLNLLTKNLAESLPASHPILSRLTANQGKPWHANEFKEINMLYQKKLRSRRYIESLQEGQPTAPKRSRRKSARALQNSVAAPIKNLNALLLKVESEVIELQSLYATADLQASDGAGHKGLNKKKHKQIKDLEKERSGQPRNDTTPG